ncbi:L-arabinose isomerase [Stigmatella sp. ncwal1]|uniref:L-arabinose isomerase n=1 Tax=Stigmatella ashevillensis TaxID=2995309 RepID=A0ABT5DKR3_9BACT|nr:L-arabinose isomerase [Stigmatella ashevillena]MDC0713720.1 L-arabinose isomerase [Stigmatella ashevillena]
MIELKQQEVWFLTGSQHLYGEAALATVAADSRKIAGFLDTSGKLPVRVVCKPTLTDPEAIMNVCLEANASPACVGVITWMHTFSPAKMWIAGLTRLQKPLAHLHTQTERELPWDKIDMDFMNLNQSAHGDREFGFIGARLRLDRKIIVGYWKDEDVLAKLDSWVRAACGLAESRRLKIVRFGGMNMREVAVTGGDRVEAQIQFGWSVNGYPVGDLVGRIADVGESEVDAQLAEYEEKYSLVPALRKGGDRRALLRDAARQEIGMRGFLRDGRFGAFTTTFEDLHGLKQLPGLACQRLMAEGYGFGAEGDWKTAALIRIMKVMSAGLPGGVSFMEDYTYHLAKGGELVLGAHMLEVCPSIAAGKPSLEIHPLDIGGKADPCRLVFEAAAGPAVNATLVDMGGRMRLIVNELDVVQPGHAMPHLPVARAIWTPRPSFKESCEAWILAGGAHHAGFSRAVPPQVLEDFAAMVGIECIHIGKGTQLPALKNELRWNDLAYRLAR